MARINKNQTWRLRHIELALPYLSRCAYCGWEFNLTIDHVIPLVRGGDDLFENTVLACYDCNHLKGPLTGDEFMATMNTAECKKLVKEIYKTINCQPSGEAAVS